jgi:hypothetical protein
MAELYVLGLFIHLKISSELGMYPLPQTAVFTERGRDWGQTLGTKNEFTTHTSLVHEGSFLFS